MSDTAGASYDSVRTTPMSTDELTPSQQAAAFHGLATNRAYLAVDRLAMALQALDLREAEVERLRSEVEHWKAGHADMTQMHAEAVEDRDRLNAAILLALEVAEPQSGWPVVGRIIYVLRAANALPQPAAEGNSDG